MIYNNGNRIYTKYIAILIILLCFFTSCLDSSKTDKLKYKDPTLSIEERVEDLLSRMNLNEKLGQMTQIERGALTNIIDLTEYNIGSILSGGGSAPIPNTPESWAEMYDNYQSHAMETRLKIPLIYGIDSVHGHNTLVGAVIFPHNIGLGATRDLELVENIGRITAIETASSGIDWTFSPCIAICQDERWGRNYESFSEDTDLVSKMGAAIIKGYQGENIGEFPERIIACAKHYAGDGGTFEGYDRSNTIMEEEAFNNIHIKPYIDAIDAGVGTIMISQSALNGEWMHGHKRYITDILKGDMGFDGFIVSDWGGIDILTADYKECVKQGVNAGIDMIMVPYDYKNFLLTLKALVLEEEIEMSRIDDAVRRILKIKFRLGLFESPYTDRELLKYVGSEEHREVAREAVQKSLVLLKNKRNILPLSKNTRRIFVAGKSADNIGNQCGGWTLTWQGSTGNIIPGTSILDGIKQTASSNTIVTYNEEGNGAAGNDVAIVVIGELPYAEWEGDKRNLSLSSMDIDTINKCVNAGVPTIVILISGRPMLIKEHINSWNAFIAAWLPGTEGQGVADILFGNAKPTGKLSFTWPGSSEQIPINIGDDNYKPLFPYGFGLTY